jgi:hypothetical protein
MRKKDAGIEPGVGYAVLRQILLGLGYGFDYFFQRELRDADRTDNRREKPKI